MKKHFFLIGLIFSSLCLPQFTSCSKDDDDDEQKQDKTVSDTTDNLQTDSMSMQTDSVIKSVDVLKYTIISDDKVSVSGYNGESLTNMIIPEQVVIDGKTYTVASIGNKAFENCSTLCSVTIPSSVDSIYEYAFWGCTKADVIINIDSDTIPYIEGLALNDVKSVLYSGPTVHNYDISNFESGETGGHPYVDLGLPSGLKWATYSVNTTSLTQYVSIESYSDTIDMATVNWGNLWRMPTKTEQQELIDGCDWQWTILSPGVAGNLGTSKTNGKQIFLPIKNNWEYGKYPSSTYDYYFYCRPSWSYWGVYSLHNDSRGFSFNCSNMGHTYNGCIRAVTD